MWGTAACLACLLSIQSYLLLAPLSEKNAVARVADATPFVFDINGILTQNLLIGELKAPGQNQQQRVAETAIDAQGDLVLQAVFASKTGGATAIIASAGNSAKTYREGAQIAQGVQIERIENDRVYLINKGAEEVLRFPQPSQALASQQIASTSNQTAKKSETTSVRDRLESLRKQSQASR